MKQGKRNMAALLSLLMLISMLPIQVWAADGTVAYAVEGETSISPPPPGRSRIVTGQ